MKRIEKTIEDRNKAFEKFIDDRFTRKFNYLMIFLAISISIILGVYAVMFHFQAEAFSIKLEFAQIPIIGSFIQP